MGVAVAELMPFTPAMTSAGIIDIRDDSRLSFELDDVPQSTATGFQWVVDTYGHSPELLSANAALFGYLALKETRTTLTVGKDTSLIEAPSQQGLDELLLALSNVEDRRAGLSRVSYEMARYLGYSDAAMLEKRMRAFVEAKQRYPFQVRTLNSEDRLRLRERLHADIFDFQFGLEAIVNSVLEDSRLLHERPLDDIMMGMPGFVFDEDMYRDFCLPYVRERIHGRILEPGERSGIEGQNYHRLIFDAYFMHQVSLEPVIQQDLR